MAFTNFPSGITSLGIPQISGGFSGIPGKFGKVLFVDASNGNGDGSAPDSALATIQAAIDRTTDGAGDLIFVFPGTYNENLTVENSGVNIIGCMYAGYERPDVVPDTGVALTVSTGQGFYCRHMRFASADSDSVIQNANGFTYDDCVFDGDSGQAATEANLRLVPSATDDSYSASEGQVINCLIRGSNGFGIAMQHALAAGGGEGTSDNVIAGCRFVDNAVSDLKSLINTNGGGAGIYLRLSVTGNQFMTSGASYKYINFSAGAGGDLTANSCLISNNWFADEALTGGTGNQIDLGGQAKAHFAGNYDDIGLVNGTSFNN